MLPDTITLADMTPANHSYDLVSRQGMNSDRRETGVASKIASVLSIKNTVDLSSDAVNRHLIRFGWNDVDATTGELYPCSVHVIIQRHKLADDADLNQRLHQLGNLIMNETYMNDVFMGGN